MKIDIKELLKKFDNSIALEDHEYVTFENVNYAFNEFDNEEDIDEGKYKSGATIYELVVYDENDKEKQTGIFVRQSYTKYGEYWSGYEYEYDELVQVEEKQKTITYWAEVE